MQIDTAVMCTMFTDEEGAGSEEERLALSSMRLITIIKNLIKKIRDARLDSGHKSTVLCAVPTVTTCE